jgi:hypothetical protein
MTDRDGVMGGGGKGTTCLLHHHQLAVQTLVLHHLVSKELCRHTHANREDTAIHKSSHVNDQGRWVRLVDGVETTRQANVWMREIEWTARVGMREIE